MKLILLAIGFGAFVVTGCKNGKQSTSIKNASGNPSRLNGSWQLTYIAGSREDVDKLYPGKKPQIVFDAATSHASGNTGCNSFAGPVTLSDHQLLFDKPLITTKMFCPGIDENIFLDALKKIQTWSVKDGITLELLMDESPVMRLTKVQ